MHTRCGARGSAEGGAWLSRADEQHLWDRLRCGGSAELCTMPRAEVRDVGVLSPTRAEVRDVGVLSPT
jgi:hypothetical protein